MNQYILLLFHLTWYENSVKFIVFLKKFLKYWAVLWKFMLENNMYTTVRYFSYSFNSLHSYWVFIKAPVKSWGHWECHAIFYTCWKLFLYSLYSRLAWPLGGEFEIQWTLGHSLWLCYSLWCILGNWWIFLLNYFTFCV